MASLFRFKQKLSTILGGRQLTSQEQAGLDAYDLEIEDAMTTGGGDSLWQIADDGFGGKVLEPVTQPDKFDVTLSDFGDNINLDTLTNAGGGDIVVASGHDEDVTATRDITVSAGRNLTVQGVGAIYFGSTGVTGAVNLVAGDELDLIGGANVVVESTGGDVQINSVTGNVQITVVANLILLGLPTSAPVASGAVWRDPITNILHVSP